MAIFAQPITNPSQAMRSAPATTIACVFCLGLLNAPPSFGVDYAFQASGTVQQNYNSNLQLLPSSSNPEGIWGSDIDVRTNFSAATPRWTASGGARFDNWFYSPSSRLNMQNQYVDSRLSYLTERAQYGVTGNFISDALLSSQSDQTQTQGVILGRVQREVKSISPSWMYQLNPYTNVNLNYSYNDTNYPGNSIVQSGYYPNSMTHSASASANHQASERLSLDGDVSFTDYISSQSTIKYVNFMAGTAYTFDIDTHIAVRGGGQYTVTTSSRQLISQQVTQFGPVFQISASRKFENSTLGLSYSHSISPSINGNLFTSDQASLNATRRLSEKFDGNFHLTYSGSSYPPQSGVTVLQTNSRNQSLYQVGGDMSYALDKNCTLNASYSYKVRDFGTTTGDYAGTQDAHIVSLSLRYNFEPLQY